MEERYNLAIDRMKAIIEEKTAAEPYREYFQHVARFILKLDELKKNVESGKQRTTKNLMQIRPMRFQCWARNSEVFFPQSIPKSAEAFPMSRNSAWNMW